MTKKRNHHKTDLTRIRQHYQETASDDRWLSVKAPERGGETKVRIRVCPPWGEDAEGFFYYTAGLHYGFSIGGRDRAIACPESINKGKCPICLFITKLKNNGEQELNDIARRIRLNRRYWVNVVDRANPEKIRIYGANKKFIEHVLDSCDEGDITDPQTGSDVFIKRTGAGLKTRYSYTTSRKSTPIAVDDWEDQLHNLAKDVVEWMTYKDMVKYLRDNYATELREVKLSFTKIQDIDEDEEEPKKKKNRKKVVEEDDAEDTDDEEIGEEEESKEEEESDEDVETDEEDSDEEEDE